jgi:hypothetical protein
MSYYTTVRDTLKNFVTGLGTPGLDPSRSVQYDFTLLDRNQLENMYRGDWLARKICDAPAEDVTREWRAWQASQSQIEALETIEKTMDLQRKVKQWITRARLYGGAALIVGVDDGNDPSQPLNLEKCGRGCLKYVVVLNRYELNAGPRIYNVMDPYYTRPAYYTIATPMFGFEGEAGTTAPPPPPPAAPKAGGFRNVIPFGRQQGQQLQTIPTIGIGMTQIHPSRVLEYAGNELPDWRLAPMGGGWGDSVLQTVVDTMMGFTSSLQSIAAIVNDGKLDVVKIPEMALNLTSPGYKNKLLERFTLSAQTKSVISALLLDKEEEWQRVQTNYSGLPMILHEFTTIVAAAADMPVSRLFGQAQGRGMQGGSTAGGPDDLRNYYDACVDMQKNEVAPKLGMLDQVMMRSAFGRPDPDIHYEWNALWQMGEAEKAAIAYQKAQATQIYSTIGLINEDAFREGVVNQLIEDSTYPGLDTAIAEYGAEPEEPEMPAAPIGFGGAPAPDDKQEPPSPNPEEMGATG